MPFIEWDASYSVGNPELDEQHRRWVAIINGLDAGMAGSEGSGGTKGGKESLAAMMGYVRNHFMTEERYMWEIGFPGTVDHIKVHNECYGLIASHLLDAESGKSVQVTEVLSFLKGWLTEHILSEDKKYAAHAAGQPTPAGQI